MIDYFRLVFGTIVVLVPGFAVARAFGRRSVSALVAWGIRLKPRRLRDDHRDEARRMERAFKMLPRPQRIRAKPRYRPGVESLEGRRLPASLAVSITREAAPLAHARAGLTLELGDDAAAEHRSPAISVSSLWSELTPTGYRPSRPSVAGRDGR